MSLKNSASRAPTVDKVLRDIREKIFLNQFDSGQPLAENMLANMCGVSRGSIRSAIQILESEGLIIVGENGRKTPIRMTKKFTNDLYETRTMIEVQAVRLCIQKPNVDSSLIASAFSDFYKLYSLQGEELYIQRSRVNTAFHRAIVKMADNISLLKCWSTLEPMLYSLAKFNYIKLGDKQSNDILIDTHQQLMDLILRRNEEAFQVIRAHIGQAVTETDWGLQEDT